MAKIHLVLQGKSGVGKSLIAVTIAQYKAMKGQKLLCLDTDPVNATFAGYQALNVRRLNILEGDEINTRHFDALVERIAASEGDVIIDNGASSFVPLALPHQQPRYRRCSKKWGMSWWCIPSSPAGRRCSTR